MLSRSQAGVLWAHNDSGDRPRVLRASAPTARLLADVAVTGAESFDWEDIARRAARDALLLGDIGDNLAQRATVVVYRVARAARRRRRTATAPAQRYELRYADGAHDAEALLRRSLQRRARRRHEELQRPLAASTSPSPRRAP